MFDAFSGIVSTANSYLFLNKDREFVGREKDIGCVDKADGRALGDYACQLLKYNSNLK